MYVESFVLSVIKLFIVFLVSSGIKFVESLFLGLEIKWVLNMMDR